MSRSTTHPAEWVFLGMAAACLLWVAAAIAIGKNAEPLPECAAPIPPTTIKPTEQRT